MCYEIGQYYAAQNMIKNINTMGIDSADRFAEAWRAMMEENYKQKAEPHKGAYHMHLNEILANLQYYFEQWADEYARSRHKEIDKYFFDQLSQELSDAKKLYIEE